MYVSPYQKICLHTSDYQVYLFGKHTQYLPSSLAFIWVFSPCIHPNNYE